MSQQPTPSSVSPLRRRMLEDILAVEEEHADDLLTFLKVLNLSS